MKRMRLTKLVLSGQGKKDAVLEFKEGLNVISGDSDTGKTYAFQCLNYILGAEKMPKVINEADGYEQISLEFEIDGFCYRLERVIGANKIIAIYDNEIRELSYKHDATNTNNISRFLLSLLLEHEKNIYVKKNSKNEKRTLSFRDVVHLCMIDETDIIGETSVFQTVQYTNRTVKSSIFKYMVTGVDDEKDSLEDDSEQENIRRSGVVQFLEKKKDALVKEIAQIEADENYQLYVNSSTVSEIIEKIKDIRALITEYNLEISRNNTNIREIKQNCYEDEILLSEFEQLSIHYQEEIKRNGMISTHTEFLAQLPGLGCPICNQTFNMSVITPENEEVLYKYFIEHNLMIHKKIEELELAQKDITERLETNRTLILKLEENNAELLEMIEEQQKILETMNGNISMIRQLDAIRKSLDIYRSELTSIEQDIIAYSEKVKKTVGKAVNQDSSLYNGYCERVEDVLKTWGLTANNGVCFDSDNLDLYIDNKPRASWGKGYRAFIMSAMVIGLMRYCCESELLHPGFVIIDSPLVSLKERKKGTDGQWVDDYMEKRMIEDIFKNDSVQQVIIFENKDLKYDLNYNYIEFRHEGDKRKGFVSI